MATLILLVLFGILSSFFATQNPGKVTLVFASYTMAGVPLYLVVLCSLLIGLFLSFIIGFVSQIFLSLSLRNKDATIDTKNKTVTELTRQVHKLELENERLRQDRRITPKDEKSL